MAGGFGAAPAGVFADPGTYPGLAYRNTNYFVDAVFTAIDDSPLIAINQMALARLVERAPGLDDQRDVLQADEARLAGNHREGLLGPTGVGIHQYDPTTRTIVFSPSAPLAAFVKHDVALSGVDTQDIPVTGGKSWSFTTVAPGDAGRLSVHPLRRGRWYPRY